jgi:K+-sensing histidine kinase KdpD
MTPAQPHPQSPPQRSPLRTLKVSLVSLLCLATVSYVDYVTGYEFLFFVFYFIPVAVCGWHLGRLATLSMAVLSGACWFLVDVLSDHHYPHEVIRYWNTFTCFLAFAVIGFIMHHLKQSRDQEQKSRRELEESLAELQDSTREIRNLQSQLQVVCAWTQRLRIEGKWVTLDEFLTSKLNLRISHGISPEALAEIKRELSKGTSPDS